jgi:hypothetical protein
MVIMVNKKRTTPTAGSRWVRDEKKEAFWKEQLALWQDSGLSVRAYCKEQGIVETSFYAWRRELIIRARESPGTMSATFNEPRNTVKDGRGRKLRVCFRQTDHAPLKSLIEQTDGPNPFVPLNVVPDSEVKAPEEVEVPELKTSANQTPALGICLTTPKGFVITIKSSEDTLLLKNILSILED